MSLANLEWYGWICLFLAFSSTLYVLTNDRDDVKTTAIPAIFICLSLWMMLP